MNNECSKLGMGRSGFGLAATAKALGTARRSLGRTADRFAVPALCAALGLAAVACGDDDAGSTFPVDGLGGSQTGPFGAAGSGYEEPLVVGGGSTQLPSGCATDTYPGEVVPVDMHLMLDRSSSMNDGSPPKWGEVTAAISSFMALPASGDLSMAMAIFPVARSQAAPLTCTSSADCLPFTDQCVAGMCVDEDPEDATSCWASDCTAPVVAMGTLPGVAPQISAAMNATEVMGRTPMAPALLGGIDYASEWAEKTPQHITILVLVTDGYPTKCAPQEINEVAAIAGEAYSEKALKTFVIGIGDGLDNLNLISQKGGTGTAIMVDSGNAGEEFLAALNLIRGSMRCSYKVPVPASGEADLNQLNVAITPYGGDQEVIPRVDSEASCENEAGYFLDDPNDPEQLTLCPASCQRATETNADVQVVIGCGAVIK